MKRKIGYLVKIHHKLPVAVKTFDKKVGAFVQQRHVNYYLAVTGDYTPRREEARLIKSHAAALKLHKQVRAELKSSHLFGADDFVSLEEKIYYPKTRLHQSRGGVV